MSYLLLPFLLLLASQASASLTTSTRKALTVNGGPAAMNVVFINTAATNLTLRADRTVLGHTTAVLGTLPASIPFYGGTTDFGFTVVPTATGAQINATIEYAAGDGTPPYASAYLFYGDPKLPGMCGIEVNSNSHADTITIYEGLITTPLGYSATFFVHVDPPQ